MNYFGPHYHSMRFNHSYLGELKPRLIKVVDPNIDALKEFQGLSPGSYTWARKYITEHDLENRIRQNVKEAAKFSISQIEQYWQWGFDLASIQNEILVFDIEGLKIINEYHHEMMELTPKGSVIVLGHINVGHPFQSPDDRIGGWEYLDSSLRECERLGHVFSIHAYGRPEDLWYNSEWLVSRFENQTQDWFFEKYPKLLMAYGEFGTSDKLDNPTGKYGGHHWAMSDEEFAQQLITHGPYVSQWSDHFLGATLFDTDALHPFEKSEMDGVLRYLNEYYKTNPLGIKELVNIPGKEIDIIKPPEKLYDGRTTDNLNMREAYPDGAIITVIPNNSIIPIYEEVEEWRKVGYEDMLGYSHSDWIEKVTESRDLEKRVRILEVVTQTQQEQINTNRVSIDEIWQEIDRLWNELEDNPPNPTPDTRVSPGFGASNQNIVTHDGDEWFIKDAFTTLDGSWEVGEQDSDFSIVQWARDDYLKPFGDPRYFDDAGAQTHVLVHALDENGEIIDEVMSLFYWPDGSSSQSPITQNKSSGWANYLIGRNIYYPDAGEKGPFSITLAGEKAPILEGIGLPYAHHVSTFIVFQKK